MNTTYRDGIIERLETKVDRMIEQIGGQPDSGRAFCGLCPT